MAQPRVAVEPTRDGALWQGLVDGLEGATNYHDWDWLDFQQDLLDVEIERCTVLVDDRPVGVFPVARRSRRGLESPYVPFPYLGPLTTAGTLVPAIAAMRRRQVRTGLVLARYDVGVPMTAPGTAEAVRTAGVRVHEDATVVVDLSHGSAEALLAAFTTVRRADMRRAVRDGSAVRAAEPGEVTELLPAVLQEAYESHGRPSPYPATIGADFEAWSAGRPWARSLVATVHGEPAGVVTSLNGRGVAAAWVGAAHRRFRSANPSVLLYHAALEAALDDGCAALDFCGWVDDGVAKYKMAFGGHRREYLSVESSLVPQAARRGLQRARALARR